MKFEDLKINELYIYDNGYDFCILKYISVSRGHIIKDINHTCKNNIAFVKIIISLDMVHMRPITDLEKIKYL